MTTPHYATYWVLAVRHNGTCYADSETGMNPRFFDAKRFHNILECIDFAQKHWYEFQYKAVEVTTKHDNPEWR